MDSDSRVRPGPASPWIRESQLTALLIGSIRCIFYVANIIWQIEEKIRDKKLLLREFIFLLFFGGFVFFSWGEGRFSVKNRTRNKNKFGIMAAMPAAKNVQCFPVASTWL